MRYRTILLIGFSTMMVLLFTLLAILTSIHSSLIANVTEIVDDRYNKVKVATDVENQVNRMSGLLTNIVLEQSYERILKDREKLTESANKANHALNSLQNMVTSEEAQKYLNDTIDLFSSYESKAQSVMESAEAGQKAEAKQMIVQEASTIRDQLLESIDKLKNLQENLLAEAYTRSNEQYVYMNNISRVFIVIGLVVGGMVAGWTIRNIANNLRRISSVITMATYRSEENYPRIQIDTRDEIGDIARAFNMMAETLELHAQQEKEYKQAIMDYSWLKTQVLEVTSNSQGIQDVTKLAQSIVNKITPIVEASYAVLFVRDGHVDAQRLVKAGTYGFDTQDLEVKSIEFGEGLAGQAALENKIIEREDLPEDYIRVGSGLGSTSPVAIMILPISYEGHVLGVLELASLQRFTPLQKDFLQEIIRDIGTIMNSIYIHMQVRNLLKESQTLTEELQSQSEELQLQQEELRSINEKLEEQYKNAEQKARELEKAKEELERTAVEIELASRYKSEFLANMSHELRTPLNSLLILAQILADNKERNLTPRQVEFAATIHKSGHNLLHLINDILDLSKIESGKMDILISKVPISEIVSFTEQNIQPLAAQKGLHFTISMGPGLPENIETDQQRVQQIITNLLSNACKFTTRGSVSLDISLVPSEFGARIAFAVRDTGIGIPSAKQQIVFDAFQQADGTTSRKYGGTGLGLSISRELANLLGGFIQVESEEGRGSTFTLFLPLEQERIAHPEVLALQEAAVSLATGAEPSETTDWDEGLKGKKVLIVDDDMRNIFALTAAMEERHMQVIFAENGREGVQMLEEHRDVDIVLMDIMMPEMDGYEAIEKIRSDPEFHKLPIIALTAKAMKHDREKCIEAGASDYISKPVNMEQLISLMRVWLYG